MNNDTPCLYIIPTPIGNLEDITIRAQKVLKEADIIACEDTRHSGNLLKLLGIVPKKLLSYHEHNEATRSLEIIELIKKGMSIALISDAGTPCISDPGYRLVKLMREENLPVIALPGANAAITALSASGFPSDRFTFLGFPPQKKGRQTFLKSISNYDATIILYESPHRILKLITELCEFVSPKLEICIAKELTKYYEEYLIDSAQRLKDILQKRENIKGEFVILLNMIRYNKEKS